MTDGSDNKRQPEESATMPPLMARCDTRAKPAARIMSANAAGLRRVNFKPLTGGIVALHSGWRL